MLDSGAFKDIPGLLNYTVIIPSEYYKGQGRLCPYVTHPLCRWLTITEPKLVLVCYTELVWYYGEKVLQRYWQLGEKVLYFAPLDH